MVTGLVTLLMVASVAANEMIIRTMKSVRSVESSTRAYFAAESGIEDALYELSPHLSGYVTPDLGSSAVRKGDFRPAGQQTAWNNQWTIKGRGTQNTWSGQFFGGQKLVVNLYSDISAGAGLGTNAIYNYQPTEQQSKDNIKNLRPSNFEISFKIPQDGGPTSIETLVTDILRIDNDNDGRINEDAPNGASISCNDPKKACTCLENPEDQDCDGQIDEDWDGSPVILWSLSDNNGRSLIPLRGCLIESTAAEPKSEICEKDFTALSSPKFSVPLTSSSFGRREDGTIQTIDQFINCIPPPGLGSDPLCDPNAHMQFEFLIVAPMEFMDNSQRKFAIPYFEYTVSGTTNPPDIPIPFPYFAIESDGYYNTYKQSISATITPRTTVPLFDFTIIQQK